MCKTQQEKRGAHEKEKQILFLPLLLLFLLGLGLVAYPIVSQQLLYRAAPIPGTHAIPRGCRESGFGEELATARAEAEAYNELLPLPLPAELDALDYDSLFESGRKRH